MLGIPSLEVAVNRGFGAKMSHGAFGGQPMIPWRVQITLLREERYQTRAQGTTVAQSTHNADPSERACMPPSSRRRSRTAHRHGLSFAELWANKRDAGCLNGQRTLNVTRKGTIHNLPKLSETRKPIRVRDCA